MWGWGKGKAPQGEGNAICRKSRSMFEYAKKRVWEGRHFPGEEEKRGEDGTLIFTSIVEHFTKSMYYGTKSKKKKKNH